MASDQCPECGGALDGDSDTLTGSTLERCVGTIRRMGCGYVKRLNGRPRLASPEALAALAQVQAQPAPPAAPAAPARHQVSAAPAATSLGTRLYAARTAINMSSDLAAQRLGVAHSTYRTWETGGNRPRPVLWPRIRALFGLELTADDLPRGYKKLPADLAARMEPAPLPAPPDAAPPAPGPPLPELTYSPDPVTVAVIANEGTSAFPGEMWNCAPVGAVGTPRTVELDMAVWADHPETAEFTVALLQSKGFDVEFVVPERCRLSPALAKLLLSSAVEIRG